MNTKLKFGIIGCSRISQRSVIPAIMQSQNAELEIIGSRTLTKAKEFSNEFNCKKFGSYDDVISDESIDVVYISTPIGTHEEWVIKAASAGKHVLCEKSSTISFESAKRMLDVCNKNNVEILEGFMFRFHPQHKKIKSLISNNSIGDLISFQGNFGFPSFPENDIRYKKELGGGFLNDSGCYPICASRMIFDEEPLGVSCKLYIDDKFGVDTRGTSILIYTNNKSASITFGNGNFYQANYTVWGTDGILSLDRAYSVPSDFRASVNLKYNTEKNWSSRKNKQYEIDPTNHFLEMIDAFCLELSQKSNCPFNFKKDFQNQAKVMEAHRISSSENRYVALDEIM
ncbi:MAG: dehydrogenase [Chloroflexi bacterium]|nr:dehydrogenase [Chloroflexota bacterium]|tara:strand:+ start:6572 stop:7597 length:1026 start_codon:yes stop_codon:yes gene_type:complete